MRKIIAVTMILMSLLLNLNSQQFIFKNPKAVQAKEIFRVNGVVGDKISGIGDVNGDGINDFLLEELDTFFRYNFYYGVNGILSTTPVFKFSFTNGNGVTTNNPIHGKYLGNNETLVPLLEILYQSTYLLHFITNKGNKLSESDIKLYINRDYVSEYIFLQTADVNNDGIDDLTLSYEKNGEKHRYSEVLIFYGGINFGKSNTPDVKLVDTNKIGNISVKFVDFDHDGKTDMLVGSYNPNRLKFYWGNDNSPSSWTKPDRDFIPVNKDIGFVNLLLDCDGDGYKDFVCVDDNNQVYIFLSKDKTNFRTRDYGDTNQVDIWFRTNYAYRAGFLNDNKKKYEMLLTYTSQSLFLSGSEKGTGNGYVM